MPQIERRARPLLGTFVEITLRSAAPAVFSEAFARIQQVHDRMSAHAADSDLAAIARGAHLDWVEIDAMSAAIIGRSLEWAGMSGGAFDPVRAAVKLVLAGRRPWFCDHSPDPSANWSDLEIDGSRARASRPLALDLGGVAKGFAVDLAAEIISAHGCSGIVNAGGDLRFIGGEERRISLRKPGPEGGFLELGEIPFPALATTASYGFSEDGANLDLIDPLAGKTPTSGFSITVFAENCALADAMTKAVLNLPDAQAADLLRRMNCSSLILESDGRLRELP